MKPKHLQLVAWGVSLGAVTLAVFAWGMSYDWKISSLSTYELFPVFGLVAFSLMWGHYVAAAVRMHLGLDKSVLRTYFEVTSLAVLAAILLHPGLLAWQLWRDGLGLPPGSELNYAGPRMKTTILLGMIALVVFLAYEFRRAYDQKPWWKYVQYASDGAILLIVIHSLRLGTHLQTGWFKSVWYFYATTLAISIVYIYYRKTTNPPLVKS